MATPVELAETFEYLVKRCEDVLDAKAQEYAEGSEDRLQNFKKAAGLKDETQLQALWGIAIKHVVSINDMCMSGHPYPAAVWDEKCCDLINYLVLARAAAAERSKP